MFFCCLELKIWFRLPCHRESELASGPRTEGLFAEITHVRGDGNDYWQVRSTDGLTSSYGSPRPAGAAPWVDDAVISDPANPSHHFSWKLSRTVDLFGNEILYHYEHDTAQDGPHNWDQVYLSKIEYVNYGEDTGTTKYLVSVEFDYAAYRPDPFSDYKAGFEIRTRKRCKAIRVVTHAGQDRTVRTYQLTYLDQRLELQDQVPYNQVSLLIRLVVLGHEDTGAEQQELPPLEFGYSTFQPESPHGRDLIPSKARSRPQFRSAIGVSSWSICLAAGWRMFWR